MKRVIKLLKTKRLFHAFVVDQFILPLQKEITCKIRHFFCSAKPRRGGDNELLGHAQNEIGLPSTSHRPIFILQHGAFIAC